MIYYTSLDTMYGKLGLIHNEKGLIKIYLPNDPISIEMLNQDYPNQKIIENNSKFKNIIKQLAKPLRDIVEFKSPIPYGKRFFNFLDQYQILIVS